MPLRPQRDAKNFDLATPPLFFDLVANFFRYIFRNCLGVPFKKYRVAVVPASPKQPRERWTNHILRGARKFSNVTP